MTGDFTFLFSKHPVYMIFWVTGACNFSCAHCFNHIRNNTGRDLSIDEIQRISKNMGHIKYLTLAGGEPLLRDDLTEIAKVFYTNNDVHMMNLVTNGWMSEKAEQDVSKILKDCPGVHISVGVSVDGPEPIHDHLRSKPGSFNHALETLNRLKQNPHYGERLTVAACGTYSTANASYLRDLALFFQEKMAIPYYVGLIRGKNVPDMGLMDIDADHYKKIVDEIGFRINTKLVKHYPFKHVRVAVDQVVSAIIYKSLKQNKQTVPCKAGRKGFVLTADGDVLLCEILNTVLGNVRDHGYSPYKILALEKSKAVIRDIMKNGCHCTWECFQRLNVVFSPVLYPRVLMEMLRHNNV